MIELKNVKFAHSSRMLEEDKDELLIPSEYNGLVAIESWQVGNDIKLKGTCVYSGISKYLLGYGDFLNE